MGVGRKSRISAALRTTTSFKPRQKLGVLETMISTADILARRTGACP
jgi:hypothetical protein